MSYLEQADLSEPQRKVLRDGRPRRLVAAGAGSGKTRLLVAYFVHTLLDKGVPLEELAAVTFTRKAGSELAERIRRELVEQGHPELARGIDRAAIGTIHGLCSRLLREQPLRAGIDPAFSILEADAASLIQQEVSRLVWNRVIEKADEGELEALASRGDALRKEMLELYERLRGMGQQTPQVHIEPGRSEAGAREALRRACTEALAEVPIHCKSSPTLDEDLERLRRCVGWLERLAEGTERPRVAATNGFFPTKKTRAAEQWLSPARDALVRYRCALAELELRPVVTVLNRLLALFHQEYTVYKESRGVLDFADLETRVTAMLAPEGRRAARGSAAPESLAFVSHILIDEFQDTNEVQCGILDSLGAGQVLMVGDERQSIYRFRGADVDVFRRRKEDGGLGQHRLDTNYRSRPEILDFVNQLFSSQDFFGRDGFDALLPGRDLMADPPVGGDPKCGPALGGEGSVQAGSWITEVLVADRPVAVEGEGEAASFHQAEARAVAARVRRLVDEEGFSQGDVVVLLPALSNVTLYQAALLAQGLDIYVVRGKGYYSQDEVADVTALLRLLVNPHDDLSLITVLRSPLVGVSDDCLYLIGRAAHRRTADGRRARSLWDVVREGQVDGLAPDDQHRLALLTGRLDVLRARVGRPWLSRLIDEAVSAFEYDLCLLAAPESKRRFANIRKLMRMAADFEALEGPDLAGFVELVGSLNDLGDAEGNAPSLAEGEDVVRIMTVHQAKGLEFPAVFLAGLGSAAPADSTRGFLVGHDGRVAAVLKEKDKNYETFAPHWGPAPEIAADEKAREREEDVRLLYVAMTRAKDRLFLVGARPSGNRGVRISGIVAALGLQEFPESGSAIVLDDICTAVLGVPYGELESGQEPEGDESAFACVPAEAPQPPCFLDLEVPGPASRQLSFSALAAFERCPRRFYLERVLGLGSLASPAVLPDGSVADDDGPDHGDALLDDGEAYSGRDLGLLVHALMERLDLTGPAPAQDGLRAGAAAVAAERGLHLPPGGIERAAVLAAAFWKSPLVRDPVLGCALREEPFVFVQGGVTVHGVMDLLGRGEECWRIVDYKSNRLDGRSPAELAESYHLQAAVYCLAALKAGAPAVRMDFLFLEKPEGLVTFEHGPQDRERLEKLLDDALLAIEQSKFPPTAAPACGDCGVGDLCRPMSQV
jgi:ATP-dependent helicase/nuclease subunit A